MCKRMIPPLVSDKVILRLLEPVDLPMTRRWRNANRRWFFDAGEITREQHQAWFEQYVDRDDDLTFIIERRDTLQAVGQVAIYHIDWQQGVAEFGRLLIGETPARQNGFAHAATNLLVKTAFREWDLHQIFLSVLGMNHKAIALYAACGFYVIGASDGKINMRRCG